VLLIDGMFDHGIDLDCAEGSTDLQCFRQGEHDVLMIPQDGLRFDPGEEANSPAFVDRLVAGQDLYVDDAFGAAHRAHASIVGPPARLPSAAGRLLAREVEVLGGLLSDPKRPFVAVLGGSKVSDKLGVIRALLEKVDTLIIGGGMCFTFLAAAGHHIGDSLAEPDMVATCQEVLESDTAILLPTDLVVLGPDDDVRQVGEDVPPGYRGLDIGPGSAAAFADVIIEARTVLWNGPMGVFEVPGFSRGTFKIAHAVAENGGAISIVGGGDSVAAVHAANVADKITHISTGGGASLEFLEGKKLPGVEALTDKK